MFKFGYGYISFIAKNMRSDGKFNFYVERMNTPEHYLVDDITPEFTNKELFPLLNNFNGNYFNGRGIELYRNSIKLTKVPVFNNTVAFEAYAVFNNQSGKYSAGFPFIKGVIDGKPFSFTVDRDYNRMSYIQVVCNTNGVVDLYVNEVKVSDVNLGYTSLTAVNDLEIGGGVDVESDVTLYHFQVSNTKTSRNNAISHKEFKDDYLAWINPLRDNDLNEILAIHKGTGEIAFRDGKHIGSTNNTHVYYTVNPVTNNYEQSEPRRLFYGDRTYFRMYGGKSQEFICLYPGRFVSVNYTFLDDHSPNRILFTLADRNNFNRKRLEIFNTKVVYYNYTGAKTKEVAFPKAIPTHKMKNTTVSLRDTGSTLEILVDGKLFHSTEGRQEFNDDRTRLLINGNSTEQTSMMDINSIVTHTKPLETNDLHDQYIRLNSVINTEDDFNLFDNIDIDGYVKSVKNKLDCKYEGDITDIKSYIAYERKASPDKDPFAINPKYTVTDGYFVPRKLEVKKQTDADIPLFTFASPIRLPKEYNLFLSLYHPYSFYNKENKTFTIPNNLLFTKKRKPTDMVFSFGEEYRINATVYHRHNVTEGRTHNNVITVSTSKYHRRYIYDSDTDTTNVSGEVSNRLYIDDWITDHKPLYIGGTDVDGETLKLFSLAYLYKLSNDSGRVFKYVSSVGKEIDSSALYPMMGYAYITTDYAFEKENLTGYSLDYFDRIFADKEEFGYNSTPFREEKQLDYYYTFTYEEDKNYKPEVKKDKMVVILDDDYKIFSNPLIAGEDSVGTIYGMVRFPDKEIDSHKNYWLTLRSTHGVVDPFRLTKINEHGFYRFLLNGDQGIYDVICDDISCEYNSQIKALTLPEPTSVFTVKNDELVIDYSLLYEFKHDEDHKLD